MGINESTQRLAKHAAGYVAGVDAARKFDVPLYNPDATPYSWYIVPVDIFDPRFALLTAIERDARWRNDTSAKFSDDAILEDTLFPLTEVRANKEGLARLTAAENTLMFQDILPVGTADLTRAGEVIETLASVERRNHGPFSQTEQALLFAAFIRRHRLTTEREQERGRISYE